MIYGIIIAILVILVCIMLLPVKAELFYKEQISLRILFLNIPIYKTTLKQNENKTSKTPEENAEKIEKNSKKLGEKIDAFREFYKITTSILKKYVSLEEIEIKIDFGTGDAPTTAISIGALWGVVYGLLGRISSICKMKKHDVQINPHYNESVFSFEGKCIIKSNLVYIIFIMITILMNIKSRKGKEE